MDRAVGVCKKVVSAFSYSWKKKSALSKAQQRLNLPTHQLITESPTRWGSRQKMVARVLEQQKAIIDVLSADKNNRHLIPTWQDIDILESMNAALTPLLEFTEVVDIICCLGPFRSEHTSGWGGWGWRGVSLFTRATSCL